jgi:hypothetical protein
VCPVEGCGKPLHGARYCNTHYRRWRVTGDPLKTSSGNRPAGAGTPNNKGYWMHEIDGRCVLRHILVAERALGKRLRKGVHVHHVDEDRGNDANNNLVICESASYHQLLHQRMRALRACGNAHWRKCSICKQYSPKDELRMYRSSGLVWHAACWRKRYDERKAQRRAA